MFRILENNFLILCLLISYLWIIFFNYFFCFHFNFIFVLRFNSINFDFFILLLDFDLIIHLFKCLFNNLHLLCTFDFSLLKFLFQQFLQLSKFAIHKFFGYNLHFFLSNNFEHINHQINFLSRWIIVIFKDFINFILRTFHQFVEHNKEFIVSLFIRIFMLCFKNFLVKQCLPRL